MMIFLSYLNFFCLITYLYMTGFILIRNPRSLKNNTGVALFICIILWNLGWVFVLNPYTTIETAKFFLNISAVGGISFGGFFLWFTLALIEKEKILKTKTFYLFFFIIPLLLIITQWTNHSILAIQSLSKDIGWQLKLQNTAWTHLYYTYTFAFMGIAYYLAIKYRNKIKNLQQKKQTTFILFTGIIAVTFCLLGILILLFLANGLKWIPYLGNVFFLIWASGLFYAMSKYSFLALTPYHAVKNIIATMSDSLLLLDLHNHIEFTNSATLNLLGYQDREIINQPIQLILAYPPAQVMKLTNLIHEAPVSNLEINFRSKDGKIIPVLFSSSMMTDSDNTVYGLVCIARDITDNKKAQEELRRAQKIESLGILAGGIAHDFNNLLGGIFGYIELAKNLTTPDQKIHTYLENALFSFHRAKNLTQQLLTFTKGNQPAKQVTSIKKLIRETTIFALSGSNIICKYNFMKNLWLVEIDQTQITQVLSNIIINARQVMHDRGLIEIEVDNSYLHTALNTTEIYPLQDNRYLKISIKDHGTGIPEADLPKIFDPFFTTKPNGVGLGLTISHSIIKNHGGYINVDSTPGSGTVFNIYLPASNESVAMDDIKTPTGKSTGGWKILLMDDEVFLLELFKEILENMNNTVEIAANGEEAVQKYINSTGSGLGFDLVILDLTVPGGMGGRETIAKLLEINPQVKGIASSGYSEDPVLINPEEYGFRGAIRKPFLIEELGAVLEEVMNEDPIS